MHTPMLARMTDVTTMENKRKRFWFLFIQRIACMTEQRFDRFDLLKVAAHVGR